MKAKVLEYFIFFLFRLSRFIHTLLKDAPKLMLLFRRQSVDLTMIVAIVVTLLSVRQSVGLQLLLVVALLPERPSVSLSATFVSGRAGARVSVCRFSTTVAIVRVATRLSVCPPFCRK